MDKPMEEAEKQGQVNRLQISGNLLNDVQDTQTSTGKRILKTRLAVTQGTRERMYLDISIWTSELTEEQIHEYCKWKQGNSVVITGKLTMRTYSGRTYIGIDASAIE